MDQEFTLTDRSYFIADIKDHFLYTIKSVSLKYNFIMVLLRSALMNLKTEKI